MTSMLPPRLWKGNANTRPRRDRGQDGGRSWRGLPGTSPEDWPRRKVRNAVVIFLLLWDEAKEDADDKEMKEEEKVMEEEKVK